MSQYVFRKKIFGLVSHAQWIEKYANKGVKHAVT